jgi:parallel beta-helix repeat protein
LPCDVTTATECQITTLKNLGAGGNFEVDRTLHIFGPSGEIRTNPGSTLTLDIDGDLIMETRSKISGDRLSGAGNTADMTFIIAGNMNLKNDVVISSSKQGSGGGNGGDLTFAVAGNIDLEPGSTIAANSIGRRAGDITMTADGTIDIDGLVSAGPNTNVLSTKLTQKVLAAGRTMQRGGKITITSTNLSNCPNVTVGGIIVSQGEDPGADTVTLEGCGLEIFGLVASVSKKVFAKVVLRSGEDIDINGQDLGGSGPNQGRVRADINRGEGSDTKEVDLFATGNITVNGPTAATATIFVVTANGAVGPSPGNRRPGGTIIGISLEGMITATGKTFQANGTRDGGTIDLQAKANVNLDGASLAAVGDFTPPGLGDGGTIEVRSFMGTLSWQNGNGDVRPNGKIELTSCGAVINTTGTNFNGVIPLTATGMCVGAPVLPAGVARLPECQCGQPGQPCIEVTKACTDASAPSQPIAFTGVVSNCGGVTLTNVTVTDNHAGVVLTGVTLNPQGQQDDSANYSGSYMPTTVPSTNTVTAQGTPPTGPPVMDTASATCSVEDCPEDPRRVLTSTADPTGTTHGGLPNYTTVQAAVNAAGLNAAIGLFGQFKENVSIGNDKQLTLTQCTVARIVAADNSQPAVRIFSSKPIIVIGLDTVGGTVGWSIQSNGNDLRGVRASGASVAGIGVFGNNNDVSWNSVRDCAIGVWVEGDSNDLRGGTVEESTDDGIRFTTTANNNTLRGASYIRNNGGDGVQVDGSSNTLFDNKRVEDNAQDGIHVNGTGNELEKNAAQNNAGDEFDIGPNNIDGGDNKANGNPCTFGATGGTCN